MKKTRKEIKEAYHEYILDCIWEDENEQPLTEPEEKVKYIFRRLHSEKGYEIVRKGNVFQVMVDWLQGLALPIEFTNHHILELAKRIGSIDRNANERTEQRVLDNYWRYMAQRIFELGLKYKVIDKLPT